MKIQDKKKFNEFLKKLGINSNNWQEELKIYLSKLPKPSIDLNDLWSDKDIS